MSNHLSLLSHTLFHTWNKIKINMSFLGHHRHPCRDYASWRTYTFTFLFLPGLMWRTYGTNSFFGGDKPITILCTAMATECWLSSLAQHFPIPIVSPWEELFNVCMGCTIISPLTFTVSFRHGGTTPAIQHYLIPESRELSCQRAFGHSVKVLT